MVYEANKPFKDIFRLICPTCFIKVQRIINTCLLLWTKKIHESNKGKEGHVIGLYELHQLFSRVHCSMSIFYSVIRLSFTLTCMKFLIRQIYLSISDRFSRESECLLAADASSCQSYFFSRLFVREHDWDFHQLIICFSIN